MTNEILDTIIIGGGPAGLTAAIYAGRRGLKTVLITKDIGGQIAQSNEVENYPGIERATGIELAQKFFLQAQKFGAKIKFEEAIKISKVDDSFEVLTKNDTYKSSTVIMTAGKSPRELGVKGEDEFKGRGVTYCATCDAPFFKDKTVIVVGGGNSALDAALLCAKLSSKVFIIHRGAEFRADEVMLKQAKENPKIEMIMNSVIKEIKGSRFVESVILEDDREIITDGVIVEIGFVIDRSLVEGLLELDGQHQVKTDNLQKTSIEGIFAAGDITITPYKQVVISAGEGAKAALSAYDYIQKSKGKKGIYADWH